MGERESGKQCLRLFHGDSINYGCFYIVYSGRRLTPQGQRDLDRIAGQVGYWT